MEIATPARALDAPIAATAITATAKNIFFMIYLSFQSFSRSISPTLQFDFYSMRGISNLARITEDN
jgi:hypothetical protein